MAAKKHLKAFRKRLERAWGRVWGWWKLEPQERGAPHFHLLLYMPEGLTAAALMEWAANAWVDIVSPKPEFRQLMLTVHLGKAWDFKKKHRNPGCVEQCRSWEGVAAYAAQYIGKVCKLPGDWSWPGRFWGEWRSDLVPRSIQVVDLDQTVAVKVRRAMRRKHESLETGQVVVTYQSGRVIRRWKTDWTPRSWIEVLECWQMQECRIHYVKRRCRILSGGIRIFMEPKEALRIVGWATGEAYRQLVNADSEYYGRIMAEEAFIGSAAPPHLDG